ncbi:MAG: TatD family hydrolase [Gammaproteobacteria bacterium]|nr:TatD family hydrolase [Gammaproteobacteria bacterium]
MDLIDTHCHIDVEEFAADRGAVLARCRQMGVARLVVPAVLARTWQPLLDLCRCEPGLLPALGLHPVYLDEHTDADIDALGEWVAREHPVAVGEIGLDYFVGDLDRVRQQRLFEAQLTVAREAGLPVLLHVRKAHDQVLATLKRLKVRGGIAHAFNGSAQQAQQYIDLGFKLGFGGMLTYERSTKLRSLARSLPLDALVLETDAPDMTVAAHHGERNSPEYLPDCLRALADARDENPVMLAAATTRNAERVLGLMS